ncbi:MAG: calcium-binding protein [Pseudomonadota bacterium]
MATPVEDMELVQTGETRVIASAGNFTGGRAPDISQLDDGNLVVVWSETLGSPTDQFTDTNGAIFGRILDDTGAEVGDTFQVNSFEPATQGEAKVVSLPFGGFAVSWSSVISYGSDPTDYDGFFRYFLADGEGSGPRYEVAPDNGPDTGELLSMEVLNGTDFALIFEDQPSFVISPFGEIEALLQIQTEDIVQLADGRILQIGFDPGPNNVADYGLLLTNESFGAPAGIDTVNEILGFNTSVSSLRAGDSALRDLSGAALSQGGAAIAAVDGFSRFAENEEGEIVRLPDDGSVVRVDVIDRNLQVLARNIVIETFAPLRSTTDMLDIIGLSGGGFVMAYAAGGLPDNEDEPTTPHLVVAFHDENGDLLNQITIGADNDNVLLAPSLTELADGRVALAYTDTGAPEQDGVTGNMQLAFFSVEGTIGEFEGTAEDDVLVGVGGPDILLGLAGDDHLRGRVGNDTLLGGEGNDTIAGDRGNDALRGGAGDDLLQGGLGNDGLAGGDGADTLEGGDGNDVLGGNQGADVLDGGRGRDWLKGHGGSDTLSGNQQNDLVEGWAGNDVLFGNLGNDTLSGGRGSDELTGGPGSDTFLFRSGIAGDDTITDYDAADDAIVIDVDAPDATMQGVTVEVSNGDTLITVADGGQTITVENAVLSIDDLNFV